MFSTHPQLDHILEPFLVPSVFGPEGVTSLLQCSSEAKTSIELFKAMAPALLVERTYEDVNESLRAQLQHIDESVR